MRAGTLYGHIYRFLPEAGFLVVKCYVGAFLAYLWGAEEPEYFLAAGALLGLVPLSTFIGAVAAVYGSPIFKILVLFAPAISVGLIVANKPLLEFILTGQGTWETAFPYGVGKLDPLDPNVLFGFQWSLALLTVLAVVGVYVLRKPAATSAPDAVATPEPVKPAAAKPREGRSVGDIINDYASDRKE